MERISPLSFILYPWRLMAASSYSDIDLAPFIDHALLAPTATPEQVEQWCADADRFDFATVCIQPTYVQLAANFLHNKRPKVCAVIGFPYGATTSAVKLFEAQEAVENGASELDVVINIGWLKAGKTNELHREIATIRDETGQTIKAILEMALLTEAEKRLAAEVCMDAGVAFLKTSTGLYGGATIADVRLLKELTKDRVGIKASGGIRTVEQALELIIAGATRLGTSRGPDLVRQRDTLGKDGRSGIKDEGRNE
jgi:deoxyribose-phosphate aldolase